MINFYYDPILGLTVWTIDAPIETNEPINTNEMDRYSFKQNVNGTNGVKYKRRMMNYNKIDK